MVESDCRYRLQYTESQMKKAMDKCDTYSAELKQTVNERDVARNELQVTFANDKIVEQQLEKLRVELTIQKGKNVSLLRLLNEKRSKLSHLEGQAAGGILELSNFISTGTDNNVFREIVPKAKLDKLKARLYEERNNRKKLSKEIQKKDENIIRLEREILENNEKLE